MSMIEALEQELEQEAATTRRVLERVPDQLAWKPHEKSMSLGQLSLHVATLPGAIARMSRQSPFPLPPFIQPSPESVSDLVPALDASVAEAKAILSGMSESDLGETWQVVDGDRVVLALPVGALLRSLMLNHWYHHRGQLTVYLRQLGVPLPSVYGPTADENPLAASSASPKSPLA